MMSSITHHLFKQGRERLASMLLKVLAGGDTILMGREARPRTYEGHGLPSVDAYDAHGAVRL